MRHRRRRFRHVDSRSTSSAGSAGSASCAAADPIHTSSMSRLFETDDAAREAPAARPTPVRPEAPLAVRMRPRRSTSSSARSTCSATGSALRTAIETGEPHSMILYGPPAPARRRSRGSSPQHADAARSRSCRRSNAGRAEVRGGDRARATERRRATGQPTIFFLDEIHRFNKAQQDALLPAVEEGLVTLIGATTENPYFEVNSALLSRAPGLRAAAARPPRTSRAAAAGARRPERGIADPPEVADEALELLARALGRRRAHRARARSSCAVETARRGAASRSTLADAEDALQRKARALRQGRRPALRLHLGLDQVDARLGPRRVALLPRGDARGRRGPALHRAPDGRSSPPRTSATPTRRRSWSRSRRPRRSSTSACPRRAQPRAGGDLPRARAEVERRRTTAIGAARGARPRARRASCRPTTCSDAPLPGREEARPRRRATSTRTTSPGGVRDQELLPAGGRGRALLRADRPRVRGRGLGRRFRRSPGSGGSGPSRSACRRPPQPCRTPAGSRSRRRSCRRTSTAARPA